MRRAFFLIQFVGLAIALAAASCGDDGSTTTSSTSSVGGGGGGGGMGAGGQEMQCPDEPNCLTLQTAVDSDGDGCADQCCFTSCDVDFVPADNNNDGCADACADAPCNTPDDCQLYNCAFFPDSCDAPVGICSDFACNTGRTVCGCDGNAYADECAAHAAGVGVDTTGASCAP